MRTRRENAGLRRSAQALRDCINILGILQILRPTYTSSFWGHQERIDSQDGLASYSVDKPTIVPILCDEEPLDMNIALSAQIALSAVLQYMHTDILLYFFHE